MITRKLKTSNKLVFTKSYAVENLNTHEKNLLCLLNETWYEHSDLFDEVFINELLEKIYSDTHVDLNYSVSEDEKVLVNIGLADIRQDTKEKKDIVRLISNNLEKQQHLSDEKVSAWNILSMFVNILNYECNTLIILPHPEPNFGNSLDTIIHGESLLVNGLKYFIKYFPSDYSFSYTAELNAENFSFTQLHQLGITFAYEIPIYTKQYNLNNHKNHWNDFMQSFYKKLLSIYDNIPIITIGCTDEFNELLKDLSKCNILTYNSIFQIDKSYNKDNVTINMDVASSIGELLASILYELDLENDDRNKILTNV